MKKARVLKLIGGLYTVLDLDTLVKHQCKGRGVLRHKNKSPKVGDLVYYDIDDANSGYISEVLPRNNELLRPPIANIDQVLIVTSAMRPVFNFNLLDRMITLVEHNDIEVIIIVTKIDLLDEKEENILYDKLKYYEKYYKVIKTSTKKDIGYTNLKEILKGKISVLAGQTGAGKSSLINHIDSSFDLNTQDISVALGRGKHTTRHSELHELCEGFVADTPGFSSLEFFEMDLDELSHCFIDFFELSHECKFSGCMHIHEPKCKVKEELDNGNILIERYENYKLFYEEIKNKKPKY